MTDITVYFNFCEESLKVKVLNCDTDLDEIVLDISKGRKSEFFLSAGNYKITAKDRWHEEYFSFSIDERVQFSVEERIPENPTPFKGAWLSKGCEFCGRLSV